LQKSGYEATRSDEERKAHQTSLNWLRYIVSIEATRTIDRSGATISIHTMTASAATLSAMTASREVEIPLP
jgi:hypothetical protein